ncbi:unnamed protein product [Brassica oleracea]
MFQKLSLSENPCLQISYAVVRATSIQIKSEIVEVGFWDTSTNCRRRFFNQSQTKIATKSVSYHFQMSKSCH